MAAKAKFKVERSTPFGNIFMEALEEAAMLAERSEGMDMKGLAHCIRALAEKEQS